VTTGLLDRLGPRELDAVLAHELSHLANRDALVMSVVATPGLAVLRGVGEAWARGSLSLNAILLVLAPAYMLVAVPFAWLARVVSRQRELVADRGAALLTGSPAAVAAALLAASDEMSRQRGVDRRAAGLHDPVHFVPARGDRRGLARLWGTHPSLAKRLAELEQLEARLQRGAY
jgi:heat shock protein HtpX